MSSKKANSFCVALVGNPNTGKSTIFNALSGMYQRVGNYPGVTVEKKIGKFQIDDTEITLVDLPGTYSLTPRSPDEMVSVEILLGQKSDEPAIDLIVCVVDANNLQRNLFLLSQLTDLQIPMVAAFNMWDVAQKKKVEIDVDEIASRLGISIVVTEAKKGNGIDALKGAIKNQLSNPLPPIPFELSDRVEPEIAKLVENLPASVDSNRRRFVAQRLLFDNQDQFAKLSGFDSPKLEQQLTKSRDHLEKQGLNLAIFESIARYKAIDAKLHNLVKRPPQAANSLSDRLDRVLTHRVWGAIIFVLLMLLMFQVIFTWSGPFMDLIDQGVGGLGEWVGGLIPEGAFHSLVTDGIIAGVGGVLVFLPQIFALFFFIAILEDCGYMARAAYLMDKLMSKIGLSGKSFIPLLSSFACAIPGIMAARVIENRRDRLITILIAPLMSCSARLPVYVLLIAAFIPRKNLLGPVLTLQGLTMFIMYFIGAAVAVVVALILRKTILKGETPTFVMELPEYKMPSISNVLRRMGERGWAFVRRAGTLIFAVSIVVWALTYFPHGENVRTDIEASYRIQTAAVQDALTAAEESGNPEFVKRAKQLSANLDQEIENAVAAAYVEQSFLGRMGKTIEPVVKPLGWDWRIACGAVASFPAREVIVGTLGVIFSLGDDVDEESDTLKEQLQAATWPDDGRKLINIPVALSIMVFFALCAQCAATLAVIKRETNSWRWPIFTFAYMTTLAYVAAFLTYQIGMLFAGGTG